MAVNECPVGKVPLYNMTRRHQNVTNSSSKLLINDFQQDSQNSPGYHMVTLETTKNMIFHGAFAGITGYNLLLQDNQYSISSIWVENGPPTELNSIKVGVGIHPSLYGDSQLRLTTRWTVDGYKKTGCYNILCPGFVQVNRNKEFALGSLVSPNSIGSASKYFTFLKIKQDRTTGHWWLIMQWESIYVGHWPKELFNRISKGASLIRFGGQTHSPPNKDSPPMGSGRLPKEKYKNSAFMERLHIIDSEYNEVDVKSNDMKPYKDSSSNCYDLGYHGYEGPIYRQAFLYGGPGGRNCEI
ncbi:protein neprosin-like [Vicia villosa]|uniref:protein neprosin-like n=1 Tax=Vicia villosa TaxID=3911 RepID=UPI00273C45BF|nr:protein neprosin-like [Vicia villosa]